MCLRDPRALPRSRCWSDRVMRVALPLLAWFLVTASAAEITWNFEGGRVAEVKRISALHFELAVAGETDQDGRNRQASWYYFRVDATPDVEVTLDMTGLAGEYNYRPNRGAITDAVAPYISYDQRTWTLVTRFEYDKERPMLRLIVKAAKSPFWIAHVPPYTNAGLADLRKRLRSRDGFSEQTIGRSAGGREIYLWTIGSNPQAPVVWLMCRQHSWEAPTSHVCEGAALTLTAGHEAGKQLRNAITWKILPLNDPDGVHRGGVRFNVNGFDLNRNWDNFDPRRMPEIAAQHGAIAQWLKKGGRIDLFLTLHNTETAEYLAGPPVHQHGDDFEALGERLFVALQQKTAFHPSRPLFREPATTTEGKLGRMTVVQGLSRDFHLPAFLMEQRISWSEKLGRRPSVADRLEFGSALVRVLAESVR